MCAAQPGLRIESENQIGRKKPRELIGGGRIEKSRREKPKAIESHQMGGSQKEGETSANLLHSRKNGVRKS